MWEVIFGHTGERRIYACMGGVGRSDFLEFSLELS